jgi:P27 family predicted phage terminase small subunit
MAGRRPTPTAIHLVQRGGKLPARLAARANREPHCDAIDADSPPVAFTPEQRKVWDRIIASAPPGLLTTVDADLLVNLVVLTALRDSWLGELNAQGGALLVRSSDRKSLIVNPHVKAIKGIASQLRLLQAELGFTPSARGRVSLIPQDQDDDPLDRFLR